MVKYTVFEHIVTVDGMSCTTYGIKAEENSGGCWNTVEEVFDITPNREQVSLLCERCNKNKLCPEHLKDVCEDFLCEVYS